MNARRAEIFKWLHCWLAVGFLWTADKLRTACAADKPVEKAPVKAVIVTGHDGPFHDWRETSAALAEVLSQKPGMQVTLEATPEFLANNDLHQYQLVVLNYCNWQRPGLSEAAKANFLKYLQAGHGLLIVHFASGAFHPALPGAAEGDWPEFRKICRRWWTWGTSGHDKLGRFQVDFVKDRPMMAGLSAFETEDELYFGQEGDEPIRVLATARSKKTGRDEPMAFLYSYGNSRVFQTTLGHSAASIRNPGTAEIIRRGGFWAAVGPNVQVDAVVGDISSQHPSGQQPAVEPWTHKGLRVTAGLVAWYDATAENWARRAKGLPELLYGKPLEIWRDGSGGGHDLVQATTTAQPSMRIDVVMGSARFDGRASFLAADNLNQTFDDVTLFVVGTSFLNPGQHRGFLAMNAKGQNDYTSGLTLDLGPQSSKEFSVLNVEGAGFSGHQAFKAEPADFGRLRRMCVTSQVGPGGTTLYVDGKPAGARDRRASQIHMDQLTVGGRFYNNGGAPSTRGFLAGEITEVLIYNRLLTDAERLSVEAYLAAKYDHMRPVPLPTWSTASRPVPRVKNAPPVQMLAPGFAVRRLPIETTNINNLLYRPDGKLVALGYDGRILLLSDTNGDGLEDRADVFWDQPGIVGPIGMALTPPGYARGHGVFLASKGRILLVVDKNGDDHGDEAVVVASGWPETKHPVDALGVEVGPDGSVYFGLGTNAFTNGYLLDNEKKPHYDTAGERGTILKVSPDFKQREIVSTGIRFPVAIRMNRAGDLFCTDQEGATWLPNGNPFDELLHIQPGRHYGFPPRHPNYLPSVIDEPSVYDYTPQHQSTCGFCFNEPSSGGKMFGPAWWSGNAFVTGYSRGKLYRTTLVKTASGYVADNALFGCLNMLTADACLSPAGELVVAVHSGGPDWGSGPGGKGQLYKISYADADCPQPVKAWAASPYEVRIAFDRPLDPQEFKELAKKVQIEYGPFVRAGDRFELFHPGYAIVEQQMESARALLPVRSSSITADRRAIILNTAEHAEAVHYAVILPAPSRKPSTALPADVLPQIPVIELTYNLNGVEAEWQPDSGEPGWTMWLPHLDLEVARTLLVGTAEGDRLSAALKQPGKLKLRTQLDLWQMLRPAVQPGSTLDAQLPPEEVTVMLDSAAPFVVHQAADKTDSTTAGKGLHRVTFNATPSAVDRLPIEVNISTGSGTPAIVASWFTADDSRPRAFAERRWFLPWAPRTTESLPKTRTTPPELAGGDWQHGKQVFLSDKAQCSKCHSVRGQGGWIGPDLSNLVHRDYTSVLRDITLPSFAINPDHLAFTLVLDDGRTLTGMVQTRGDHVAVGDIKGVETVVPRSSIESMTPTVLSIMPEGLPKALGDVAMRDLLTFLLMADPSELTPAPIERPGEPPPRSRAEVEAVFESAQPVDAAKLKPLEIVLASGPKDHGPSEHDYPLWRQRWTRLLSLSPQVHVTTAEFWPSAEQWKTADGVVIFSANQGWSPERAKEMDEFFERGGGMVFLHWAVNGQRAPEELASRIGLAWQSGSKYRHGPLDLEFASKTKHPIIAGFDRLKFIDESYWNLVGDPSKLTVLATQAEEGQPQPLLWTCEPGQGRVFCSILGHYNWTFDDPLYRVLLLRGMAWTMNQPIDRFNDLIYRGARVNEP